MALGPNLPILDLQNTGTGRAPGAKSTPGGSSDASGFEQLLSLRMKPAEPPRPASSRQAADTARQEPSDSRKPQNRSVGAQGRPERTAAKDDSRAKTENAERPSAEETDSEEQEAQEGKTLPLEVAGLPLPFTMNLPAAGSPGSVPSGGQNSFVTWMQESMKSASGEATEGVALDEMGLEEAGLDGLDLESLSLGEEGELKLNLNLLPAKGELADTKLQLQTFSPLAPVAAAANREPQVNLSQYSTSIQTPVHDGKWGEQMVNKVLWLTSQNIRSAEIHLNPADLGPLEVKIQLNQDQATVQVQAQNAGVREALEQNVHRLREALAGSGLGLANFDVSSQAGQQQAQEQHGARYLTEAEAQPDSEPEPPAQPLETGMPGLVNTYV